MKNSESQAQQPEEYKLPLGAFLRRTSGETERKRALRALTLHMLEGHAPSVFRRASLEPVLKLSVVALKEIPLIFGPDLHPDDGMARVDAWYVQRQRGLSPQPPDKEALRGYLQTLYESGYLVHAWLFGEMAHTLGVDVRIPIPKRPLREESRLIDLYWLTHLFLLETRYLQRPLPRIGWRTRTEELLTASSWIVEQRHVDLGAEVAICLQLARAHLSSEHQALLDLILRHRQTDGTVLDPSAGDPEEEAAHTTAASLLALAGAEQRS